ncbi:uncharacterized protein LOC122010760 [Zingiber officinale]|uniref:uncharacterized protein LOC122010760 n=1 Tax=Zingiber officinale TaxID=94328 RepID=UPI001C4BF6B4|nr:uncharacterized protein LOC122010760 [Zingiber officinale]
MEWSANTCVVRAAETACIFRFAVYLISDLFTLALRGGDFGFFLLLRAFGQAVALSLLRTLLVDAGLRPLAATFLLPFVLLATPSPDRFATDSVTGAANSPSLSLPPLLFLSSSHRSCTRATSLQIQYCLQCFIALTAQGTLSSRGRWRLLHSALFPTSCAYFCLGSILIVLVGFQSTLWCASEVDPTFDMHHRTRPFPPACRSRVTACVPKSYPGRRAASTSRPACRCFISTCSSTSSSMMHPAPLRQIQPFILIGHHLLFRVTTTLAASYPRASPGPGYVLRTHLLFIS